MNYSPEKLEHFPWIVSSDTLKTETLLVRYWQAAETIQSLQCDGHSWAEKQPRLAAELERLAGEESSESDWSEDRAADALDRLIELLQDAAPAGFYFGASEGDGACIGFWLEQEWVDALEESCLDRELEDPAHAARFVEAATDYGLEPDTLCDGYCGTVSGLTAEEAGAEYSWQLAEEMGTVPDDAIWPMRHINWKAAWHELELSDNYGAAPAHVPGMFWIFRSV